LSNPKERERVSIREVLRDKKFLLLILSILSLTELANTLIAVMGIYLREVYSLRDVEIYRIIGLSALGGVLGGVFFGRLSDKFGVKKVFPVGFFLWVAFVLLLYFIPRELLLLVGFWAGISLAHLWTTSRVYIIESFPTSQVSLRFSFLSLTERIASTTGLITWSFFLLITGDNYRLSALLMVVFPIVGFVIYLASRRG